MAEKKKKDTENKDCEKLLKEIESLKGQVAEAEKKAEEAGKKAEEAAAKEAGATLVGEVLKIDDTIEADQTDAKIAAWVAPLKA